MTDLFNEPRAPNMYVALCATAPKRYRRAALAFVHWVARRPWYPTSGFIAIRLRLEVAAIAEYVALRAASNWSAFRADVERRAVLWALRDVYNIPRCDVRAQSACIAQAYSDLTGERDVTEFRRRKRASAPA